MYHPYTRNQTKQIDYLQRMNEKEIRFGLWNCSYDCSCRTCNESHQFGSAEMAERFIRKHRGCDTWVVFLR
jgi:hypothetical protein